MGKLRGTSIEDLHIICCPHSTTRIWILQINTIILSFNTHVNNLLWKESIHINKSHTNNLDTISSLKTPQRPVTDELYLSNSSTCTYRHVLLSGSYTWKHFWRRSTILMLITYLPLFSWSHQKQTKKTKNKKNKKKQQQQFVIFSFSFSPFQFVSKMGFLNHTSDICDCSRGDSKKLKKRK